jgi:hypothetical protein
MSGIDDPALDALDGAADACGAGVGAGADVGGGAAAELGPAGGAL